MANTLKSKEIRHYRPHSRLIYANEYVYLNMWWLLLLLFSRNKEMSDASFTQQVIDDNISIGYGMALGDVDGDSKPDIILADQTQIVWYRNGDWKRFVITEKLTRYDNVCVAAKDVNGDGKVEIAIGAQWNPGETSNRNESGAVFFLERPADPTRDQWTPVTLQHEPTVHRMRWEKFEDGKYYLVVLPLHGVGNQRGQGVGVKMYAYPFVDNGIDKENIFLLDSSLHLTHNFDAGSAHKGRGLYIASKEGIQYLPASVFQTNSTRGPATRFKEPAGEIRLGFTPDKKSFIATIEPMHGNNVVVYTQNATRRLVLDSTYKEGHALGIADFMGTGGQQFVAGWRYPNPEGKVGIKLFYPLDKKGLQWDWQWIDENGMACEDIQVLDVNNDGKPDIVASGRATKNLKIYWNQR